MAHDAKSSDPTFGANSRGTWEVVRRVAVYLRPYKLLAATTILCAVLSLLASFAFPKLTAYALDEVIGKGRFLAFVVVADELDDPTDYEETQAPAQPL